MAAQVEETFKFVEEEKPQTHVKNKKSISLKKESSYNEKEVNDAA